jgi:hypothetical protein
MTKLAGSFNCHSVVGHGVPLSSAQLRNGLPTVTGDVAASAPSKNSAEIRQSREPTCRVACHYRYWLGKQQLTPLSFVVCVCRAMMRHFKDGASPMTVTEPRDDRAPSRSCTARFLKIAPQQHRIAGEFDDDDDRSAVRGKASSRHALRGKR